MFQPSEPEAPVSLSARQGRLSNTRARFAIAVVLGEAGTTCSASAGCLREASLLAQEAFWRATAEGAYQ